MPDVVQIAIQATDLASKVIGGVGDSLDKLGRQTDETDKKIKLFGLTTDQIGSKMTAAGKIATVGLTLPIAGLAVAASKAASDLNETMNKIDVLFGDSANEIKKWSETSAQAFGQSKQHALDSAASFAMFGKSAGLAGNEIVKFAQNHTVLASDLASFNNTSPQEAFEAIGAALRGETEPIRRYNVLINEATLKDEALRQGLIKTVSEALTPQQKILATSALIFQQTTAAQGDYARTADGVANATRTLNEQFQDTLASLGQALLPTVQKAVGIANDLLKSFNALDQPTKDLIVGFGLMAAAAGPVLTIGGKLVSVFGTLTSVALDVAGGVVTMSKSVGETAGYLKTVGINADSVKFAFQNLKASGALLGAELAIIAAGLIAIGKFLEEVGNAAQATTEDLIAMSKSGDVFKQAAATTEILTNGQNRLRAALNGTHEAIKTNARDFADYRSSIEATAKAAGYEIDAQGNLITVTYGLGGRVEKLTEANYALTESQYRLARAQQSTAGLYDESDRAARRMLALAGLYDESDRAARRTKDGLLALADAQREANTATADTAERMNALRMAMAGALKNELTQFTDKQSDLKKKSAELKEEIDKLTAANGRAVTVTSKATLSDVERAAAEAKLAALQEDYTQQAMKKNETELEFQARMAATAASIESVKGKLGEATTATTSYIDNSKKIEELSGQYNEINKEIAANAAAHEDATRRILFGYAEQQLAVGGLSEAEATALDALAVKWGLKSQQDVAAMKAIRDAAAGLAVDGSIQGFVDNVTGALDQANGALNETQLKMLEVARAHGALGATDAKPIEIPVKPMFDIDAAKQATAKFNVKPIDLPVKPKFDTTIDTSAAIKSIEGYGSKITAAIPKEKTTKFVADTAGASDKTGSYLKQVLAIPKEIDTNVNLDARYALQTISDVSWLMANLVSKTITVTVRYNTIGSPPPGYQHGADFIVPPNPSGGAGDYFPFLAAPGERVIVQTPAQQNSTAPSVRSGNTYNYTNNIFNPLAAAMLLDQQRRDRIGRSEARMGV